MSPRLPAVSLAIVLGVGVAMAAPAPPPPKPDSTEKDVFPDMPGWYREEAKDYRVDPHIAAAAKLQAAGKHKAVCLLSRIANDPKRRDRVIILCRMLFAPKPKGEFRRPMLGGAVFLGDTGYAAWPLEPVEVVDGVPFLVVRGYELSGQAESPDQYLEYCLRECVWGEGKFAVKTAGEKREAVQKLLHSPKWKSPLSDQDKQFLEGQIK